MTEAEWQTTTDWKGMLKALRACNPPLAMRKSGRRKLRLLGCACCRAEWHLLGERSRTTLEVSERAADGLVTRLHQWESILPAGAVARSLYDVAETTVGEAEHRAACRLHYAASAVVHTPATRRMWWSVEWVLHCMSGVHRRYSDDAQSDYPAWLCHTTGLFRCIFGNPFRPVAFNPTWRTETAVTLASGIYAERAFDRLPILADALEEAGCDSADVLSHCRAAGPHARGCWAVDAVLGK